MKWQSVKDCHEEQFGQNMQEYREQPRGEVHIRQVSYTNTVLIENSSDRTVRTMMLAQSVKDNNEHGRLRTIMINRQEDGKDRTAI
jgi:hypothetical protein